LSATDRALCGRRLEEPREKLVVPLLLAVRLIAVARGAFVAVLVLERGQEALWRGVEGRGSGGGGERGGARGEDRVVESEVWRGGVERVRGALRGGVQGQRRGGQRSRGGDEMSARGEGSANARILQEDALVLAP
jgi:hypothetical protein